MTSSALVYGLAVTGVATTRALLARGWRVTVADDRVTDATRTTAAELGVELVEAPTGASLAALVGRRRAGDAEPRAPRAPPALRGGGRRRACRCAASSSWPTGGSRPVPAAPARWSPSRAPTARRRRPSWRRRWSRPADGAPRPPGTRSCRSSRPSTATSMPSSSSARASASPSPSASGPRPRCGSTWRPTTWTGTARWPATRRPRPACGTTSGRTTWPSATPTTRSSWPGSRSRRVATSRSGRAATTASTAPSSAGPRGR